MEKTACALPTQEELIATELAVLADATPMQLGGVDMVLERLIMNSKDKRSMVSILKRIADENDSARVEKVTQGFLNSTEMLVDHYDYFTPKAVVRWSEMLTYGGPSPRLDATVGVMHAIDHMIKNPRAFNLNGKKYAVLLEVPEDKIKRVVDVVFVELKDKEVPASVTNMKDRTVLARTEVKWLKADNSSLAAQTRRRTLADKLERRSKYGMTYHPKVKDGDELVGGEAIAQFMKDVEKSIERQEYMSRNFLIIPQDYPKATTDKFLDLVNASVKEKYGDEPFFSTLTANIKDCIRRTEVTRDFEKLP